MHSAPSPERVSLSRPIRGSADLLAYARHPHDDLTLALAGVIGHALATGRRPLIRGLAEERFQHLLNVYFPQAYLINGDPGADPLPCDEFEELLALLLDYRTLPSESLAWLSYAVASAAMGEHHLWQDMGLPHRPLLSRLLERYFRDLAARNVGDMKWKKFFYRQLCQRAGVPICKAPHCAKCVDYRHCFAPEDR